MQIKLIEQALLELQSELEVPRGYHIEIEPDGRYIYLIECCGKRLMMIMATEHEFWLYGMHSHRGATLDRQLEISYPGLVDEIQYTINLAIERYTNAQSGA